MRIKRRFIVIATLWLNACYICLMLDVWERRFNRIVSFVCLLIRTDEWTNEWRDGHVIIRIVLCLPFKWWCLTEAAAAATVACFVCVTLILLLFTFDSFIWIDIGSFGPPMILKLFCVNNRHQSWNLRHAFHSNDEIETIEFNFINWTE